MTQARRAFALLLLLVAVLALGVAQAAFTVTRTSSATFYTDTSVTPNILCNYQAFGVTSSTAVADAWVRASSFSGGLGLGGNDDGVQHLGRFTAGQTRYAFFYVCSSFSGSTTSASLSLATYDRNPALAAAQALGGPYAFSYTIDNTLIQAGTNQVTVIFAGPNPSVIGGLVTMTVEGDTGTIGNAPGPKGPFSFTPATFTNWRADAFELFATNVSFSGGNSGSYDNQLAFASLPGDSDSHYVATYYFRALGGSISSTPLSPLVDIASGTQMKHTATDKGVYGTGLLPIEPAGNSVLLSKLVSATTLPAQGGVVTYTLRVTNSSGYTSVQLDDFVDTLPPGATYVNNSSTYAGSAIANPTISGQTLTWNAPFSIPAGGAANLVFQATLPPAPGLYTNSAVAHVRSTVIDTTYSMMDNVPATAATRVLAVPTVVKSFSPVATAQGSISTLTLTLANPNATTALSGVAIADTYPAGLVNAATPNAATTCTGATITGGTAGGNSLGLTGATIAAGGSCTVTIAVTSATAATYTNATGAVTSTNAGTGLPASASITFTTKPTLAKTFTPVTIPLGATSRVAITVTNNNNIGLTALGFGDALPAGMTVAATPNLANTCAGTVTGATAGSTSVSLAGGAITLPAVTCQVAFDVTVSAAGAYANTASGAASDQTGTAGPASNAAPLTVFAPPTVAKSFSVAAVGRSQPATLTVTLTNPNAVAITGVAFTDRYPSDVQNASSAGQATTTCGNGSVTAVNDADTLALAGGTIPANGSCTVTVSVYSTKAGTYTNTIAAGAVTTATAGSNTAPASAQLIVNSAPTIVKSFSTNVSSGVTTMTLAITNKATSGGVTGLAFTDNFPTGLAVAATPALTNNCGGTVTGATSGANTLSLSGGSIASAGASCQVTVSVISGVQGVYSNTTTGVSSSLGTGGPSNTAVYIAPGLAKSFAPNTTGVGDVARMTITISNPSSTTALTNVAFTDTYPANMTNTASPSVATTCSSGSVSGGSPNGNTIGLSSGQVPAGGTCTISVNVSASAVASYYNQTGNVRSNQGVGVGAADTLYVTAKPTIAKSFSPAAITVGGTSTLGITLENNNGANGISALAFNDAFPAGLVVAATPALANTCGGSVTGATSGSATIALSGGTLAANARCTITVAVTSATAGTYSNQTDGATSTETGATPGPRSNIAVLAVNLQAPTVAKSFAAPAVGINTDVAMTITLTNPGASAVTGVNFTDTYPAGLVNSGTPNLASTCAGSATAAAGSNSLALVGGAIPALGSCSVTVNVQASAAGTYVNSTGALTTANAGTASAASATLRVFAPPVVAKSFAPAFVPSGGSSTMTVTVTNPASNPGNLTAVAISDAYPPGLTNNAAGSVACPGGGSATLTGGANGGASVGFNAATIPPGATCTITQSVATTANVTNTTSTAVSNEAPAGTAAFASLATSSAPSIAKAFSPATVALGGTSTITFTITNPNPVALTAASFTDTLAGMQVDAAGAAGGTCAGASGNSFTAAQAALTFTGLTIPVSGACTVTVVVRAIAPGSHPNTSSGVASNQAPTGPPSNTATLTATGTAPTIAKAFSVSPINAGGTSTLTITIANANASAIAVTAVTDTFPPGLTVAAAPNIVNACSGGAIINNSGGVTLTGGNVPANGSCSFSIDVTSSTPGASLVNTIPVGALATSAGSNTAAASATLDVRPEADLSITKTAAATVVAGGIVTYTIVVSNAGPQAANAAQLSDIVPGVLTGVAAACGNPTGGGACGAVNVSGNTVTSGITTLPSGATVTFIVTATAPASGTFANSASVVTPAGVFDPTDPARSGAGNNTASVSVTVVTPDLRVTKSHTGNFVVGAPGAYTIVVDNTLGTAATSGTITVVDTLPAGLAYASATGTGWSCSAAGQVVTCSSSASIAAGASNPGAITLAVSVGSTAVGSITNAVTVSGGGESAANSGNNSAFDPTFVVAAATNSFSPDNAQVAVPGSAVTYAHVFTAGSAGSVSFSTASITTPANSAWTQQVYRDTDCNGVLGAGEAAAPLSGAIAMGAGDTVCIIVRDSVPMTAAYNAQNAITVTATFTGGLTYTRTDVTTVGAAGGAGLTLAKSVRNLTLGGSAGTANTARPNDVLEYTITYTNTSAGALSSIVVTDSTPSFTTFVAASCNALPAGLSGCTVTTAPAAGSTGSVAWTLTGSLISSGSGSVAYTVRVAP